jgi:hypothetical protein
MKRVFIVSMVLLAVSCLTTSTALALQIIAEERFESVSGAPVKEDITFSGQGYKDFVLKVRNGDADGSNQISSAVVTLNEVKILGPADFNQNVLVLDRAIVPVDLQNTLSVNLRSNPGGFLHIQILGEPALNLPPDPGPAGDETIEGVDANGDGVRDDVGLGKNQNGFDSILLPLAELYGPCARW